MPERPGAGGWGLGDWARAKMEMRSGGLGPDERRERWEQFNDMRNDRLYQKFLYRMGAAEQRNANGRGDDEGRRRHGERSFRDRENPTQAATPVTAATPDTGAPDWFLEKGRRFFGRMSDDDFRSMMVRAAASRAGATTPASAATPAAPTLPQA